MATIESVLHYLVYNISPIITLILELIGIILIFYGSIKALWMLIQFKFDIHNRIITITLGEFLSLALQFKMGAEIIKTVTIRELSELFILSIVVVLRIVLSIVLHWEVKSANEEDLQNFSLEEKKMADEEIDDSTP